MSKNLMSKISPVLPEGDGTNKTSQVKLGDKWSDWSLIVTVDECNVDPSPYIVLHAAHDSKKEQEKTYQAMVFTKTQHFLTSKRTF